VVRELRLQLGSVHRLFEEGNLRRRLHQIRLRHFLVLNEEPIAAFEALRLLQVVVGYLNQLPSQRQPVKRRGYCPPEVSPREDDSGGSRILVRLRTGQLSAQAARSIYFEGDIPQSGILSNPIRGNIAERTAVAEERAVVAE
jgi:hypothetical protein